MKKALLFCLAAVLLLPCARAAERGFSVGSRRAVSAYADNALTVRAPVDGIVKVTIGDKFNEYRHLEFPVTAGEQDYIWDGCAENGDRIGASNGSYLISAVLEGSDGAEYAFSGRISVTANAQTLIFALPSSDRLYLKGGEEWFAELRPARPAPEGRIDVTVFASGSDEALGTAVIPFRSAEPFNWVWGGSLGGEYLAPGRYDLVFAAREDPGRAAVVTVELADEAAPAREVAPTGPVMPPDGADDAAIWAAAMKTSVVADIKDVDHETVYAEPSKTSAALGTLHGQSQGVEVLAVEDGWARITAWRHEDGEKITGYVPADHLKVVSPNGPYALVIDKRVQEMTLYEEGRRVVTLPVSTGLTAPNKLIRETAAGAFLTQVRIGDFESEGRYYQHCIRYDGGNLIHSVGYRLSGGYRDYTSQRAELGQKGSHGCIRVPESTVEGCGIDAWWLYTHLPFRTRVFVIDDPTARECERIAALAGKQVGPFCRAGSSGELPAAPEPPELTEGTDAVTVTFGGDAVIGTREAWWGREDALPRYLEEYGCGYPFHRLAGSFGSDDMTVVNLECVLKADKSGENTNRLYRFRGLPEWTQVLLQGGIEQVNIANNHFMDYGDAGRKSSLEALKNAGVIFSGYGETAVAELKGHLFGFAGIRETVFLSKPGLIADEIAALREAGCEVIVYTCHWGTEYSFRHNDTQERMARAAADAGADLIVGGHPHVVQGIGRVDDVPVIWSLGNLMFGGTIDMTTFDAMLARVTFVFGQDGYRGCLLQPVPVLTSGRAAEGVNDYCPMEAMGEARERILMKIRADSDIKIADVMWFPVSGQTPGAGDWPVAP